jgi:hypothetical protein
MALSPRSEPSMAPSQRLQPGGHRPGPGMATCSSPERAGATGRQDLLRAGRGPASAAGGPASGAVGPRTGLAPGSRRDLAPKGQGPRSRLTREMTLAWFIPGPRTRPMFGRAGLTGAPAQETRVCGTGKGKVRRWRRWVTRSLSGASRPMRRCVAWRAARTCLGRSGPASSACRTMTRSWSSGWSAGPAARRMLTMGAWCLGSCEAGPARPAAACSSAAPAATRTREPRPTTR